MKMLQKAAIKYLKNQAEKQAGDITTTDIMDMFKGSQDVGDNLSEVTYYTCLKMLSESLGKISLDLLQDTNKGTQKIYDHDVYKLLKHRPNPYMTPSIFRAQIEFNRNHYGNAFVWLNYQGAKLKNMWVLDNNAVRVLIDDVNLFGTENKLFYEYHNPKTGKRYLFSEREILHLKTSTTTSDGFLGMAVQDILASTMEGNKHSQAFLNNLNKKGMTAKAVLEYTGDLDKEKRKVLKESMEELATGAENAGGMIPIPLGMKLTPLDLKLTDSQYFELRKYSALQIAAAFGIKPNHINNYEKSSYANSEMQNLSFYVDTLLFILKQYEEEMNWKLLTQKERDDGYHFKFNVNSILRADIKTQAECLAKFVNNGIKTPNECREQLDIMTREDGDKLMVNGNYIPIEQVGRQYAGAGGGENGGE